MHDLRNEMGMSEIEEQHHACQVRSIFKNKRFTDSTVVEKIQQLWKKIE